MSQGDAETKPDEIQTTQKKESKKELMELHQVNNERQRLAERWMEENIQLKLALADKDEELSKSIKRWQMGTLDHVAVVKQLSSERAKLDKCHQKCASLEESHLKQLQEMQEAHRREISDMKQQFENELARQEERCLREISELEEKKERRLTRELGEKDEQMKLQLSLHEGMFKRILREKMATVNQERADLKTMALLCYQWRVKEQQWHQQKQQLEGMLEEQEMTKQWLVLASRKEIHHLRDKILKLKVRARGC